MEAFLAKGFYTTGALKTNRVIFPPESSNKLLDTLPLSGKQTIMSNLVTVGKRSYYVFRYEGSLNAIENAVVLTSYSKNAFGSSRALRAFICTDCSLSTQEILNLYQERWSIEVFFQQAKQRLALDKYQIRTSTGIRRYWLLMSLAFYICCLGTGAFMLLPDGLIAFQTALQKERITYIYQFGVARKPLDHLLAIAA